MVMCGMMSQVGFEMLGKSRHRKEGRKTGQASSPPARIREGNPTAARFVLAAGELAPNEFFSDVLFCLSLGYKGF